MLVFWKEKLVLLAVPKTGTSALERVLAAKCDIAVLDPPELKHAPMYRYNRFFRPMFEKPCKTVDMETMAIIREPISWLGSWYRYRRRPFNEGRPASTHEISFDEFVQGYCAEKTPEFARVGSQARFVEPSKQGPGPDHLFRYEDPASWIGFLEQRLGYAIDLPKVNVSPQMVLDLSPQTEQLLRQTHADEFALYDGIGS
jgi:hypothetical protein